MLHPRYRKFPVKVPVDFVITDEHRLVTGLRGNACVPEEDPLRPRFADNFAGARQGGHAHDAIDIFALPGAWVVSTTDGRVVNTWRYHQDGRPVDLPGAGTSVRAGNYIRIIDSDGFVHYYAHLLNRPMVRGDAQVYAGQIIGRVGRTGRVFSCPHLHYQVRRPSRLNPGRGGAPVNPYGALVELMESDGWRVAAF